MSGRLYDRLPAFWRERDAEQGFALRQLLSVIEGQAAALEDDIHRLHDGLFVETADPWIIPYIGDLVGTTALFDVATLPEPEAWAALFPDLRGAPGRLRPLVAARARPDVAKTIYYRRRKGTAPMLEEMARDVTGWACRLVEFWALLGWTQWIRNRTRPGAGGWVDLRSTSVAERIRGPFDTATRSMDVRPFAAAQGRDGIPKTGFFLHRLRGEPLDGILARAHAEPADWRWRFSPLGQDAPLFTRPRREAEENGQAGEFHLPAPIRPGALHADLVAARRTTAATSNFYGPFGTAAEETSLAITLLRPDGTEEIVPAHRIACMRLEPWQRPPGDRIGVDAALGRIALGMGLAVRGLRLACARGTVADLGGGGYARAAWLLRRDAGTAVFEVSATGALPTLRAALAAWAAAGRPDAVIRIADSSSYRETSAGPLTLELADPDPATGRRGILAIEAVDRARPHLRLDMPLVVTGDHPESMLTLSGLLVEGGIDLQGTLRRLRLLHCTLVPGRNIAGTSAATPPPAAPIPPSLLVAGSLAGEVANAGLSVELTFCIAGPLRIPVHARQLILLDSVVDGVAEAAIAGPSDTDAPPLTIERSTILGDIRAIRLPMMDTTLVTGTTRITRRDEGCVRFSYTRPDSRTPRRVRCQPDLAVGEAIEDATTAKGAPLTQAERNQAAARARLAMQPVLASRRYGQPAYAQIGRACPPGIAEGAEDGSAMGMTCHLKEPQRLSNLRRRLEDFLPLGLEPGFVFVT